MSGGPAPPGGPPPSEAARGSLEAAFGAQYTIERLLGRGGMGAVYLARENALDRQVAIKVLPPDRAETGDSRERFRREARTAAKLTHPNIVPLHTFGEAGGVLYFVMGFVRGEPLSTMMRREGGLPAEDAIRIVVEVADALDYAHRQGIVHRDVKPDNVLIDDESGRALLADFGVARAEGAGGTLTAAGSIVGTPHYMSPEQASGGQDVDGRSDIYSLGVMGYAMLAGKLPFDGKTAGDVLVQHLTKEPPPLAPLAPGIPDIVPAAIMRCLAKDPAARWPDARSLRDALRAAGAYGELPEPLQGLDVYAQWLVGALLPLGFFSFYSALGGQAGELGLLLHAVALMAAIVAGGGLARLAVRARRNGFHLATIFRSAFHKPSWWVGWYPRGLRRPGDVWDRLPPVLRRMRVLATLWLAYAVLVAPAQAIAIATISEVSSRVGLHPLSRFEAPFYEAGKAAGLLLIVASLVQLVSTLRWIRATGFDDDVAEALIKPTSWRSLWMKPKVAALLLPVAGRSGERAPRSPAECLRAILAAATGLSGDAREAAKEAADAARTLIAAIEVLDRERAVLESDGDPAEGGRLAGRLAALGPEEAAEGEGRRQMRDLLRKQLDLVRDLARRLDEARARRTRYVDRLGAIRSLVDALPRRGPSETAEPMARLRALCAEAEAGHPVTAATVSDQPTRER